MNGSSASVAYGSFGNVNEGAELCAWESAGVAANALAAIIWWTHRANIARLLKGTEPRIELGSRA